MSFVFTCPLCDAETKVADSFVGQVGPCVCCGKQVTVVRPTLEETTSPADATQNATGLALLLLLAGLVFFGTVGTLIFVVVVPKVHQQRQQNVHERTRQRLLAIGQALRSYHDTYGSFPPATTYDANGKPMHSWRVLILPQLGYPDLYAQYDFDLSWDSVENSPLAFAMPMEYASAVDPAAIANGEPSFYVITGNGSAFPTKGSRKLTEIRDAWADTVLVAETISYGFSWLEPRDFRLARLEPQVNGSAGQSFASQSPRGPQVLTAAGEVHTLRLDAPAEAITAMATIDGGEPIFWQAVAND
jgi:type II secretory pathway pseudopilin PulG